LKPAINCGIYTRAMNLSTYNPGRFARLALLLVMLAAQSIAVAHDIGEEHGLQSHSCATCVIGHGLGTAVSFSYETPTQFPCHAFTPTDSTTDTLAPRTNYHLARGPPRLS
jgi:hypothetical protein